MTTFVFGVRVAFRIEPFPGRNAATTREAILYRIDTYERHPAFYRDAFCSTVVRSS